MGHSTSDLVFDSLMHNEIEGLAMRSRYKAQRPSEEELDMILATFEAEMAWEAKEDRLRLHPRYGRGYDSDVWPFDIERAKKSKGYRFGVIRAYRNPYYNKSWRWTAMHNMHEYVLPYIKKQEDLIKKLQLYYQPE